MATTVRPLTSTLRLAAVCAGTIALALTTACGGDESQAPAGDTAKSTTPTEAAPPAPAPKRERKTIHDELSEKLELPASYPEDGPVYPGSTVNVSDTRGSRLTTVFSTSDGLDEVTSWVEGDLRNQGWVGIEEQAMPNGTGKMVSGAKEGRRLSVLLSRLDAENKTLIAVSVNTD